MRRVNVNSVGFWGYLIGSSVITAIAIPVLITALLIMLPARVLVAIKRTLS